jgi:hypothetical protein
VVPLARQGECVASNLLASYNLCSAFIRIQHEVVAALVPGEQDIVICRTLTYVEKALPVATASYLVP